MSLDVLDWRRQVAALYREVRDEPDPAVAHALWCAGRQQLVSEHPASPNRSSVLRHATYDPSLSFGSDVVSAEPVRLEIPTATDGVVPFERIGTVQLGDLGSLDVWWLDSYGGGVWLPIRDASPDTYGGGRYILDTVKGADLGGSDGRLIVDLNFAYNPSCAYDEAWACPLAPPGNILAVAVNAGELIPAN
ncbi:MAG TPA: DUF1684 domain-containing protein [Mycobacteriales bacterium]|jgi:hypothetical protein|nr:DUF1684 domain-containing protein [Mycobacteriales bacterium]